MAHVIRLLGGSTTITRTVSSHGVRILSMDGGGIRGLVMVELLRKLEVDTGQRITELFDVICGTSAGGLLAMALLLGRSLVEIEEQFWRISTLVFRKGWFTTAQQLTYTGSKYDARVLEDLFRDQYGSGQLLDSPQVICRVALSLPVLTAHVRTALSHACNAPQGGFRLCQQCHVLYRPRGY